MSVLHLLAAPVLGAVRRHLDRSRVALAHAAILLVLGTAGMGLLLAAALMGLAVLMGPILASCVLGVAFLVLAGILAMLWKRPPAQTLDAQKPADPPLGGANQPLAEIAFLLGFILTRNLMRKDDKR